MKKIIEDLLNFKFIKYELANDLNANDFSNYFFAVKDGSSPVSAIKPRTNQSRRRGISDTEVVNSDVVELSDELSDLDESDDLDDFDVEEDELESEDESSEETEEIDEEEDSLDDEDEEEELQEQTDNTVEKPVLNKILKNKYTYYIIGGVLLVAFIVLFILVLFPDTTDYKKQPIYCGGPSPLDTLKVITTGPNIKNQNETNTLKGYWLDHWDFYDYVTGVLRHEVGTSSGNIVVDTNGKEILETKEYSRTKEFAYYQSQAIVSASYAINPQVGNYSEEQFEQNRKLFFRECPLAPDDEFGNITEQSILEYIYSMPSGGYMLCPNWSEDERIIIVQNNNNHQGSCNIDYGCKVYYNKGDDAEVVCRYDEEGKLVESKGGMCDYNSKRFPGESNRGKKIYLEEECQAAGKSNLPDGHPATYEHSCKNKYCEHFPNDIDCINHNEFKVPKRGYVNVRGMTIFKGALTTEDGSESNIAKELFTSVIDSVKGILVTTADGVAINADFKGGIGMSACMGRISSIYPIEINDMCHARRAQEDKSGEIIEDTSSSWFQSVNLGWSAHRILNYWYDAYVTSWSKSGIEKCKLVTGSTDKKLDIFNVDLSETNPSRPIKYPDEDSFGALLVKHNQETAETESNEKEEKITEYQIQNNIDYFNNYIYAAAMRHGLGTGVGVSSVGIALIDFMYLRDLRFPYTFSEQYNEYGANPLWGTPYSLNGFNRTVHGGVSQMPLGLDCVGFTNWVMYNAGIKSHTGHSELFNKAEYNGAHPYARKYDSDYRRVSMGNFGDILYKGQSGSSYSHSRLIVGFWFSPEGVITGNIIAEANSPEKGLIFDVYSVRTGNKMTLVYIVDNNGVEEARIVPHEEITFQQGKVPTFKDGAKLVRLEYIDFCYRDPYSTFNYEIEGDTSSCGNNLDYAILDYSTCYEDKIGRDKICEKETFENFYKEIKEAKKTRINIEEKEDDQNE